MPPPPPLKSDLFKQFAFKKSLEKQQNQVVDQVVPALQQSLPSNPGQSNGIHPKLVLFLEEFHKQSFNFLWSARSAAYHVKLESIDVCLLLDRMGNFDEFTQELAVMSPRLYRYFQAACHAIIQDILKKNILIENVIISLTLKSVPQIPLDVSAATPTLSLARGIITKQEIPKLFTLSKLLKCSNAECRNPSQINVSFTSSDGSMSLVKRSSTGKELALSMNREIHQVDCICACCACQMTESIFDSISIQKQYCEMTIWTPDCTGSCLQSIHFTLDDTLVNSVQAGDLVEVTLVPKSKYKYDGKEPTISPLVRVFNIQKLVWPLYDGRQEDVLDQDQESFDLLAPFLDISDCSPWIVSATLVSLVGGTLVCPLVWRKLKMALLLSLVSVCEDDAEQSDPLHLLLSTTKSYNPLLTRLVQNMASLKRNQVCWRLGKDKKQQHPQPLLQLRDKNAFSVEYNQVKGGIMLSTLWRRSKTSKSVMETIQTLSHAEFQKQSIVNESGGSLVWYDWNCVLWIVNEVYDCGVGRRKASPMANDISAYFNVDFDCDAEEDTDVDEALTFDTLTSQTEAGSQQDCWLTPDDQIKFIKYLDYASSINPTIPLDILSFFSCYISALRMQCPLPLSLEHLTRTLEKVCKSHARLCHRGIVLMDDALFAVYFLDGCLSGKNGSSLVDAELYKIDKKDMLDCDVESLDCDVESLDFQSILKFSQLVQTRVCD